MYYFTDRKRKKFYNTKTLIISKHLRKYIIFSHTLHKEMWQWLSDNPNKNKRDWPRWKHNGGDIEKSVGNCFACKYSIYFGYRCKYCPFNIDTSKSCLNDLYIEWCFNNNLNEKKELATQIKNFPVKKFVKCV